MIVKNSKTFTYVAETNELTIEIKYLNCLEDLTIQFRLSTSQPSVRLTKSSSDKNISSSDQSESQQISSSVGRNFSDLVISLDVSLIVDLKGANAKLVFE